MFDEDPTQYDPNPWGARTRMPPPIPVRSAPSVAPMPTAMATVMPMPVAPLMPVMSEADLSTVRVTKWPPLGLRPGFTMPRFALPIGGVLVMLLFALYVALPSTQLVQGAARISASLVGETTTARVQAVANVESPPIAPACASHRASAPAPVATHVRHDRASKRPQLVVDISSPLGGLRRGRSSHGL